MQPQVNQTADKAWPKCFGAFNCFDLWWSDFALFFAFPTGQPMLRPTCGGVISNFVLTLM